MFKEMGGVDAANRAIRELRKNLEYVSDDVDRFKVEHVDADCR